MSLQNMYQAVVYNGPWLVADFLIFLAYLVFLLQLTEFFSQKSYFHGGVVTLVYLIFCTSVWFIRKLPGPTGKNSEIKRGGLAFFAIFFGVFITYIIAEASGFFENLDKLPTNLEGGASLLVLAGFVLWLVLAFLYMILIIVRVKPSAPRSKPFTFLIEFSSMLGINLMILTITAFWNAYFAGTEPYQDLALGGKILIFLVTYVFFLLFFAPPRMLFLLNRSYRLAWITFIITTTYFVWDSLSRLAWQ